LISANKGTILFLYAAFPVLFLVSLLQFMPVQAQKMKESDFNFVAAGDWGCGHEALNTFSMMKSMKPELYLGLGDYSYQTSIDCWFIL
jgi:phosphodiesterase/alkaline phosphatase D-like protein